MGGDVMQIPPLPEGFTLDQPQGEAGIPPLPEGFTLDAQPKAFSVQPGVLAGLDTEEKARKWVDTLPEDQREAGLTAWADARVARERADNPGWSRFNDIIERVSSGIPAIGAYTDEADAATHSLMGGDYEAQLAYRRAQARATEAAGKDTAKLGTLPIIGDVHASGIEKAVGALAGGAVLPQASIMKGTGFLPNAVNTGATVAGYGAAQGFGAGEGAEDRINRAAEDAAIGAAGGATLGGAAGKVLERYSPAAAQTPQITATGPNRAAVIEAADRLPTGTTNAAGAPQNVTIPEFMATDSGIKRGAAGLLSGQPLTGQIIRNAAANSSRQLGEAASKVADDLSTTGRAANAADITDAARVAGEMAKEGLENWVTGTAPAISKRLYDAVDNEVQRNALSELRSTRRIAGELMASDMESASSVNAPAVELVIAALQRPGGMTYTGIKELRTHIGQMLDGSIIPEAGTPMPALNRLYGALSNDLRTSVQLNGSPKALSLFDKANLIHRRIAEQKENIAGIIGKENTITPEAFTNKVVNMASTGTSADITNLLLLKKRMGNTSWGEIASAIVQRLGRGQNANAGTPGVADGFSPDRFIGTTGYGRLSKNGKAALFSSAHRQALDDIATVSSRLRDLRQFQNPSGTAQVTGATSLLGMVGTAIATANPVMLTMAAGQVGTAAVLSRMLSRPATAKTISHFGNAVHNYATSGTGRAMLRLATANLAKAIADETGDDERQVRRRLEQSTGVS